MDKHEKELKALQGIVIVIAMFLLILLVGPLDNEEDTPSLSDREVEVPSLVEDLGEFTGAGEFKDLHLYRLRI